MKTKLKYLSPFNLFILMAFLCFSCEKELSDEQTDYFIKFYGTYDNNYPADIVENQDGGYVIVGSSETDENGIDIIFITTDKYGRQVGDIHYYGSEYDDEGLCVEKLDNGYLIGGYVTNTNGFKDGFLMEIDEEGNQLGEMFVYPGDPLSDQEFKSVRVNEDNTYMAVGYSGNTSIIIVYDPATGIYNESYTGTSDTELDEIFIHESGRKLSAGTKNNGLYLVHIDDDGNEYAQDDFEEDGLNDLFASFLMLSETNYLMLSNTLSGSNYSFQLTEIEYSFSGPPPAIPESVRVNTVDEDYSVSGSNEAASVVQLSNGNLAMLSTKIIPGDKNMFLFILDSGATLLGEPIEFGGSGDQEGVKLLAVEDGLLILGTNTYEGNSVISLIKTDNQGNIWN